MSIFGGGSGAAAGAGSTLRWIIAVVIAIVGLVSYF